MIEACNLRNLRIDQPVCSEIIYFSCQGKERTFTRREKQHWESSTLKWQRLCQDLPMIRARRFSTEGSGKLYSGIGCVESAVILLQYYTLLSLGKTHSLIMTFERFGGS